MRYKFDDINKPETYVNCRVMFVVGKHNLFNNIVSDRLKQMSLAKNTSTLDLGILKEFGVDVEQEVKVSNTVDFETFTKVINMPSVNGKWFTSVNLGTLSKKHTDWLKNYMKNPSDNGILVISSTEYKHYRFWLNQRMFNADKYVHLIELSFPRKDALKQLVFDMFNERNVSIEERAIDLFIVRMSSSYDDYEAIIDKICSNSLPSDYMTRERKDIPVITYQDAFEAMRGIENFVLDDLLEKIAEPLSTDNPNGRSSVFKMMGYLIEEYGARSLVNLLLAKIDELIEFRLAINSGCIPIIVDYNVEESKKMLGEESKIAGKSDYQFKKLAKLASKTSLKDWVYLKLILMNTDKFSDYSYARALYSAVTRSVNNISRIDNNIGLENILYKDRSILSTITYEDEITEGETSNEHQS